MKINQTQSFSLRAIVGELIDSYNQTGANKLQVINNVSSELTLFQRTDTLAPLIGDLLSILSHAENNQPVLVSAMKMNGGYKLYAANRYN